MKGKEGLQAMRRQYEAAMEHLDRVTSEMADLKVRTKLTEVAAGRVPALEADNERLRRENKEITNHALEHERKAWAKEKADLEDALDRVAEILREALDAEDRFLQDHPETSTFFNVSALCELDGLLGSKFTELSTMSRELRRSPLGNADDLMRNLKDQDLRELGLAKMGEKRFRIVDRDLWEAHTARHRPG